LNLLVAEDWRIKLADFGLSRFTKGRNLETFKKLCGTFHYCAPEIFNGMMFTPKSDVFSFGIVLWELLIRLLTRKYLQPYKEYPQIVLDFQIIVQAANGLRPSLPEETPHKLVKLYKRCINGEPEKRPTARELVIALKEIRMDWKKNKMLFDSLVSSGAKSSSTLSLPQSKSTTTSNRSPTGSLKIKRRQNSPTRTRKTGGKQRRRPSPHRSGSNGSSESTKQRREREKNSSGDHDLPNTVHSLRHSDSRQRRSASPQRSRRPVSSSSTSSSSSSEATSPVKKKRTKKPPRRRELLQASSSDNSGSIGEDNNEDSS